MKLADLSPAAISKIDSKDRKALGLGLPATDSGIDLNLVIRSTTEVGKLNKLEKSFLYWLRLQKYPWIGIQCWRLQYAHKAHYTPDFLSIGFNKELIAWETKGFMRDQALIRLKAAARTYPFIHFKLVYEDKKTNGWDIREVEV